MTRCTSLWPAAVVVVVLLGCGPKDSTSPQTSPSQPTTKAAPDTKPQGQAGTPKASEKEKPSDVAKVTAEELMKGVAENRKATEEKYPDGGVIEVTGVLYRAYPIDDKNSSAIIKLYGHVKPKPDEGDPKYIVSCNFGHDEKSPASKLLATLKPGQKVTVRGTNTGFFNDAGGAWVRMSDCVFIDPKP